MLSVLLILHDWDWRICDRDIARSLAFLSIKFSALTNSTVGKMGYLKFDFTINIESVRKKKCIPRETAYSAITKLDGFMITVVYIARDRFV